MNSAFTILAERRLRRAIRGDLLSWCRLALEPQGLAPARHHCRVIEELEGLASGRFDRLMLLLPPGSAKALALDTPIPTPEGWCAMGNLRVGDRVFDENGQPCSVVRVSPVWRDRPVYRVRTDCGDEIIADADHEWRVRLCRKPRLPLIGNALSLARALPNRDDQTSRFKLKRTWELARTRSKRPLIERAKALELPEAELPIEPYLLGVWLGDGNSAGLRITSSLEDQPWLRGELARLGHLTSDSPVPTLFGVVGVRARFAALGLLNDPMHSTFGEKHIPPAYLRASSSQRLALLQGLVDTGGTVYRKKGSVTFTSTRLRLASAVRELVRSLGVKAGWFEGRAMLKGRDCGPIYRVNFYHAHAARMPLKAALCRDQHRTPDTYVDMEPAGTGDTVCMEVDSPSHLFLCGRSMTPTHNSTYAFQDNWTGADILVPQASVVEWIGTWGGWQAVSFPLGDYLAPAGDGGFAVRSVANDVVLRPGGSGRVRVCKDGEPAGFASLLGRGSPAGVVAAVPGSDYRNLDGGAGATLWVKRSGSDASGWVAVA